ncbi:hypothetical protein PC9H_003083 [Pleurotus ostreatus]|uniref:DUF5648 domain-containing protein n=1 Tax=Pleurotus ostreatus TaxID=5322 RepID=A0A8H7A081_PLEOS|nr:uncharacterized protein PC9H_003083 [Pleurotus ostreatus]KAF7436254.1 hypothetical protein PC9H_003083 [Pleurotus ostreatus]KAJ8701908.1 hypothetical protein PTI98_000661 [Pleurotus ostreatus]
MRLTYYAVVCLLYSVGVHCLPAAPEATNVTETGRAPKPCPWPQQSVPLLRGYSPSVHDHFYTTDGYEMYEATTSAGYFNTGAAGRVFKTQVGDTGPLYRLWGEQDSDHFYTTSGDLRDVMIKRLGYTDEGVAGYVFLKQYCGSVPLYRLYNHKLSDNFYTTDIREYDEYIRYRGYVDQGKAAFVLI